MAEYRFYQLDVFTDRAFGGNPLAVFPDADGLDASTMQHIAREMNLSETTFVFPSAQADFRVRIFTPSGELPFAGHPVVGTHWLLALLGRVRLQEPVVHVAFELGVGVRTAALHVADGQVTQVMMDHQAPQFFNTASPAQIAQLAACLGLPAAAILDTGWPVQVVSTGIRQLFVPVRSLAEVESLRPARQDARQLAELCQALDPVDACNHCVMVLTTETLQQDAQVHTRMFAHNLGIPEDPATGSASGGLGAYLVRHGALAATPPTTRIFAEQGMEMERPSRIEIEVDGTPDHLTMVRVAGQAVLVIEGTLRF